ncbi:hypothetical protein B0186_11205 [Canicola haemoglobinophilus]|uniref:Sulfate transport protein cysz n=1 Tax=Canicola haemoglobinophilus TaxID=733 RepID=A0A1V4AYB9_9PAST|nr:hypothetical protein [Canicola haemoglobinophilus]OOR95811.1 hypothetical protein B0186_11205 [Canicola haemoglobinophilus]STO59543.1 sulfate transport protein cysz [Canicola haemoglobinophilus]
MRDKHKQKYTINRANQIAYKYLKQTQKAIIHCNALGFTVLKIDFMGIKPRIEVQISGNQSIVNELIESRKAVRYAFGNNENLGRWEGYYTMLEGIRVCWQSKRQE